MVSGGNEEMSVVREVTMRLPTRFAAMVGVLVTAGAVGVWLSSSGNSATEAKIPSASTPAPTMSVLEMHNMAHLEFLPVQPIPEP